MNNREPKPTARGSEPPPAPVRVTLISFGSPWHYALWNNLSVDTLAGHLEGVFGRLVDVQLLRLDDLDMGDFSDSLLASPPDILGLSIELGTLSLVNPFMAKYRGLALEKQPLLVLGNQVPTYFPERFLEDEQFDRALVCLHEGEKTLEGLVRFVRGDCQLTDIPNLVFRDSNEDRLVRTQLRTLHPDELIHPSAVYTARPGITNMIQASRGCIFSCSFCTRHQNWNAGNKLVDEKAESESDPVNWRPFHLTRVFKNVERFVEKGITELEFCDDEFFGGRSHRSLNRVNEFAEGMREIAGKYDTRLTFRLFTTPLIVAREPTTEAIAEQNRHVRETFHKLIDAGLVRVYIGLESANMTQKLRYNRTETLSDTTLALSVLREMGLDIDVGFIMFDPYLTVEEMLENVRYFRDQDLVRHNTWPFRPLVVNEGTPMKRMLEADGLLTGRQDPDFLSYEFRFQVPEVGEICEIVQSLAQETAPIFYALKTISKAHWRDRAQRQTRFARWACEENARIYLDLMEDLGQLALRETFRDADENRQKTKERIRLLVNRVKDKLDEGLFDERERDKITLERHISRFEAKESSNGKAAETFVPQRS